MFLENEVNSRVCYRPDLCLVVLRLLKRKNLGPLKKPPTALEKDEVCVVSMEGGDSALAIVRGSRHAGLAVTLLPEAYFKLNRRKCLDIDTTRVRQSSVETNKKRILQHVSRYDVSYQVSNYIKPSLTCNRPCSHKINSLLKTTYHLDPFVDSLRKYPAMTSSADFIRKVLRHTQLRHKKRHMKNIRHLIKSRSQQTYKMANSKEEAVNTTQEGFCNTGTSLNQPLPSMEKRCSSQRELMNYTYDYLKGESLVPSVDVRYFTEIKKAMRRRLRKIINKKSTQCPVMSSRYDNHKRHGKCVKSPPNRTLPSETKTLMHSVSSNIVNSQANRKSCFCQHPLICDCKRKRQDAINSIFTNSSPESNKQKEIKQPVKQTTFKVKAPKDFEEFNNNMGNEKILKEISNWMKEMPVYLNFNETDKLKQESVMKKLANTLKYLLNQTDFVPKVKPEIVKCLTALPIWRPNEPIDEANFIDDLVNKLIKRFINLAEHNFVECITRNVQDLPFEDNNGLNDTHIKYTIDKFIAKLKPLALNRPANDKIYKEVLKLNLIDLLNDLNLKLDKSENELIYVLAEHFADQLCHIHLHNYACNAGKFKNNSNIVDGILDISFDTILEWLLNIPGLSKETLIESKKAIENLVSSLRKIQMRGNNSDKSSDMNKIIISWLQNFLRENNVHLDPKTHDKLVERLISKFYNVVESSIIPKSRKRWDECDRSHFAEIKETIETLEDNKYINMQNKTTSPINLNFKSTQTMHEPNQTNNCQNNFQKNYRDIENFNSRSHMSQSVTNDYNTVDFTGAKTRKEFLGPIPLNASSNTTKNNEEERTSTSIEEYHSDSSSILRNINAISKKILDKEFGNLKAYKESNNKSKISIPNTFKDNTALTSTFEEKMLLYDNFTTSTPLTSSLRDSMCDKTTSIDHILINKQKTVNKTLSNNIQYLHRLECAIYDWLKTLNIGVKDLEKRNLAESIASDFLDRKKYLELSSTKTSEIQELEQLKYQIYRRLYNFTNSETLSVAIAKVNDLYQYLTKLSKPEGNMSNEISNSLDSKSFADLKLKIKSWLHFIPSQLYLSNDNNNNENLIKDLITKLHTQMRSGNYGDNIKSEILLWLPKLLKIRNKDDLNDLAENLKFHIENIQSIDTLNPMLSQNSESNNNLTNMQIPIQDTSEFVIENFRGVILEWLRIMRPFPRNMMTNTSLTENFSSVLANELKKVFENNSNIWSSEFEDLLIKEVAKNLKHVLCDRETDSLYQTLARDFITYLKQNRLFHGISDRIPLNEDECKYENEIRKAVIIWSQNLLLQSDKSFEDIEQILNNFIDILSTYMKKDINSVENRLRVDTLKILKVIPLKIHQIRHNELEEHIKSLVNIMRTRITCKENIDFIAMTLGKTNSLRDNANLQRNISNIDDIHSIIKNWCNNIPLYVGHLDDDRAKLKEMRQNIASEIMNFFDKLNTKAIYSKDDFYELLRSEINKLLKNMPMSRELQNCLNILIDVVIEQLKDVTYEFVNREKKESVTSTYKLLLHEAINKTLSLIDNPTIDEQISFNLLKEKLANAFIELHNPTNDDEIRNKYKDKLCDVIDKFCKDYLNQSIIIPVNSEKVKDDLDRALKNVSVPTIDIQNTLDFGADNINPKTSLKIDASTQFNLSVPSSTSILSVKELEHMQRIRARSTIRMGNRTIFQKDVSTSPLPMDMATQTEVNTAEEMNQTSNNMVLEKPSLWREVSPQVVVKEFYWDSSGSKQSVQIYAPSEISQRLEPRPTLTTISQIDKITNMTKINSKQSSEINQMLEDTAKHENSRADAVPKHTIDSLQQTSSILTHPIVSCAKSYLESNQREMEPDYNEKDINLGRKELRSDPISFRIDEKTRRIEDGSEETKGDVHIRRSITKKNIYENVSKRISEDQQIEGIPYTQQCYKDDGCGCNNISTKCKNRTYFSRRQRNLKHCAKSFVCFCPHPSNFFFKRDF